MIQSILKPLAVGGVFAFLSSCATQAPAPETTLSKTEGGYQNPYPPGSYDHFKAEKTYPKTYNVWTNSQLISATDASNSSLKFSLDKQRGFLMNGDQVVMDYPVSSGTASRPTPAGKYEILEKIVDKRSNAYGRIVDAEGKVVNSDADSRKDPIPEGGEFVGAPMKFWMRLTWSGIGHHIGNVPRYPASHACIRGPKKVVPVVYSKVGIGTPVVIE